MVTFSRSVPCGKAAHSETGENIELAIEARHGFFPMGKQKVKRIHAILLPVLRFGNNDEEYYQER